MKSKPHWPFRRKSVFFEKDSKMTLAFCSRPLPGFPETPSVAKRRRRSEGHRPSKESREEGATAQGSYVNLCGQSRTVRSTSKNEERHGETNRPGTARHAGRGGDLRSRCVPRYLAANNESGFFFIDGQQRPNDVHDFRRRGETFLVAIRARGTQNRSPPALPDEYRLHLFHRRF